MSTGTLNGPGTLDGSAADDAIDDDDDFVLPKRERDDEEMDITPMIDITFLLLIFFVVCSTMDPSKMGEIPSAKNGTGVSDDESVLIFIDPVGPDTVRITREDKSEFSSDEDAQVSEIVEYVTDEMETTLGKKKRHVMIFSNGDVAVNHVFRVQTIIGDAFDNIDVTYIAIKEE